LRHLFSTLAALLIAACSVAATSAGAAVVHHGAICTSDTVGSSIVLTTPPATQTGDILIASIASGDGHNTAPSPSPSTGWTQLDSWVPGGLRTASMWFRKATANGATNYTFSLNAAIATSASIDAYGGVDGTTPVIGPFPTPNNVTGNGTAIALPDATALRPGSLRVSAVQSFTASATTYSPGLTEGCDQQIDHIQESSVSSAYEPVGVGVTPSRTATISKSGLWNAITVILQPPPLPCSLGGVSLAPPGNISFAPLVMSGLDQTTTASTSLAIDGENTTGGWSVSLTSTTFTAGANKLPDNSATVTGATPAAGVGNCLLPTGTSTYPITVPSAAIAPAAVQIFNGTAASGTGPVDLGLSFALQVPARSIAAAYTSTWTFTVAATP
jgi:hypothetical protein